MGAEILKMGWVKNTCKIGQGAECCRYLVCGAGGFECAKLDAGLREAIDQRHRLGTMNAMGDNCDGRPEATEEGEWLAKDIAKYLMEERAKKG